MPLQLYRKKRNFALTREPRGEPRPVKTLSSPTPEGFSFVIQKHAASHLHYDFRLELGGVLLSWAIPKGPSLDPSVKRLAMQVEDHPLEYGGFEGTIPQGQYGGGTVEVWDRGRWVPEGNVYQDYERGRLTFALEGQKLHGGWHLVRAGGKRDGQSAGSAHKHSSASKQGWLLIKRRDSAAKRGHEADVVDAQPDSAVTGRNLEQIARDAEHDPDAVWDSDRKAKRGRSAKPAKMTKSAKAKHAPKAALPEFVEPQLATLSDVAPQGDDWLHEIKLDGYRILARRDAHGDVKLFTRRGNDWSERMPQLAKAIGALPIGAALLDGEVVVLENGVSNFQRLQNALGAGRDADCVYYAFDLLHLNGHDLQQLPLLERKARLQDALARAPDSERVRYSEHVLGNGEQVFAQACKLGAEGSIAKLGSAPYTSGRTRSWLKLKCHARQEFVIGGFTEPAGAREHIGALLLGIYDDAGKLQYAGRVGTGFSAQSLSELRKQFKQHETDEPAFDQPPRGTQARGVHWLAPKLVAEIEYAQRTRDGIVRHASFLGLRQDKAASDVHEEVKTRTKQISSAADKTLRKPTRKPERASKRKAKSNAKPNAARAKPSTELAITHAQLTHPERVLYAEQGITKADLALYYAQVGEWMLPELVGRPLTLVRCPEGHDKQCFFQKHPTQSTPDAIHRIDAPEKHGTLEYMMVDDAAGLMGLVQVGALEIHTWGSRSPRLQQPDRLIFDMDPAPLLPYARVVEAAQAMRELLEELSLVSFVKTTGGKGLHVVVPITPSLDWEEASSFCKALAERLVRKQPERYVAVMSKARRTGKVFIDYLRNARGATAVSAYSTRARDGATVATPISWEELAHANEALQFTIKDVPKRLAKLRRDPWAELSSTKQRVSKAALRTAAVD